MALLIAAWLVGPFVVAHDAALRDIPDIVCVLGQLVVVSRPRITAGLRVFVLPRTPIQRVNTFQVFRSKDLGFFGEILQKCDFLVFLFEDLCLYDRVGLQ